MSSPEWSGVDMGKTHWMIFLHSVPIFLNIVTNHGVLSLWGVWKLLKGIG